MTLSPRRSLRCLALGALMLSAPQAVSAQERAALKLTDIPKGRLSRAFGGAFSKYVSVFGVHIFATRRTGDAKVLHAASVMAQYLDNDADGRPDDPKVIEAMTRIDAFLAMTADEDEFERLDHDAFHDHGFEHGQNLFDDETNPGGGRFDASLEEVLHLISDKGYARAYPKAFAARPGSALAKAMDIARGGHFKRIPRRYPKEAWYHYDDESCDYSCMITEYFYWALTSLLGAQAAPERQREIAREWELPTRALLLKRDQAVARLLTDKRYKLPTRLPDGDYKPKAKRR